ncbi:biotin/lipoyl-containing protein, partial [Heyndrickxia sporothermodurans]
YNIQYYKDLAKELENQGAHILAIKDMAGLLKPQAAYQLISELKETIDIPIHLHTHDTSGNGLYTYAKAIDAGVDIVDVALNSMAGLTSQPSLNGLYYALEGTERKPKINIESAEKLSDYWEDVRKYYRDFESGMNSPHTEVYRHEMPGGQYSNLQQQAKAVGLGDRWDEVKEMYQIVNRMFGDIVKVTPSSKVVGDMALFMVQNDLTEEDVYSRGMKIDFPDSVVELFQGYLGQPVGGFPKELQKVILKDREPITIRPGELMENVDLPSLKDALSKEIGREANDHETISYALYPKVFLDYVKTVQQFGDVSVIDTPTFFYGMRLGEEIEVEIEKGKTLFVQLVSIGQPRKDGTRIVYFELNGQPREIIIKDESIKSAVANKVKADPKNEQQIGATMPGTVIKLMVSKGDRVNQGDHLMITEAMKMETTVQAPFSGVVKELYVQNGEAITPNDLLIEIEKI